MAELVPGDEIPSDCTSVGKLPVRMLTSTDGALAYATGTGVTSIGKLLMSSREQDYRDAFAANNLTICDDNELGYDFCAASSPLRLPLKAAGAGKLLIGLFSPGYDPLDTGGIGEWSLQFKAVMQSLIDGVANGKTVFYSAGSNGTSGGTLGSDVFNDINPAGWTLQEMPDPTLNGGGSNPRYNTYPDWEAFLQSGIMDVGVVFIDTAGIGTVATSQFHDALVTYKDNVKAFLQAGGAFVTFAGPGTTLSYALYNVFIDITLSDNDLYVETWNDLFSGLGTTWASKYLQQQATAHSWVEALFTTGTRTIRQDRDTGGTVTYELGTDVTLTDAAAAMFPGVTAGTYTFNNSSETIWSSFDSVPAGLEVLGTAGGFTILIGGTPTFP